MSGDFRMKKIFIILMLLGLAAMPLQAENMPGLSLGSQAPDFEAVSYKGNSVKLSTLYKNGPVVLIFYRGGWCHFCNLQLQDYQQHWSEFEQMGVPVIALSVDTQDNAAATVKQKDLSFEVLSNPGAEVLEAYNAVYHVPDDLAELYKAKHGIDLEAASGRTDHVIAVPATYVIDSSGKIVFVHTDIDYKNRKTAEEILDVLRGIPDSKI